jgi:hypothetical protein
VAAGERVGVLKSASPPFSIDHFPKGAAAARDAVLTAPEPGALGSRSLDGWRRCGGGAGGAGRSPPGPLVIGAATG